MLELHIHAETLPDLFAQVEHELGRKFEAPAQRSITEITPQPELPSNAPRRGRPPKDKTESPTPPSEPAASSTAEVSPSPATHAAADNAAASATPATNEMVRAKMMAVVQHCDGQKLNGMGEATKLLQACGFVKVGAVQEPADCARVIAACDERLAK